MRWWPASAPKAGRRIARKVIPSGALPGLGRAPEDASGPPPPLPDDMARGAAEMQRRLEDARERLKRDIAPPPDDEGAER